MADLQHWTLPTVPVLPQSGPGDNVIAQFGLSNQGFNGATWEALRSAAASRTDSLGSLCVSTGQAPLQSFAAQSALGTGGAALDNKVTDPHHSLFVVTGPGVTGGVVTLQGSNDANTWFNTTAAVTTNAANAAFAANLANFPFRYIRAAITTAIVGGTVSAWIASAG